MLAVIVCRPFYKCFLFFVPLIVPGPWNSPNPLWKMSPCFFFFFFFFFFKVRWNCSGRFSPQTSEWNLYLTSLEKACDHLLMILKAKSLWLKGITRSATLTPSSIVAWISKKCRHHYPIRLQKCCPLYYKVISLFLAFLFSECPRSQHTPAETLLQGVHWLFL